MTQATFASAAKKTVSVRRTDNGMKTNDTSLNANVDLFFQIGASRGKDITATFERAYQEDRVIALRIVAWARDVRGGAGERSTFRNLLQFIEINHPQEMPMMINVGPAFGRWDDILELKTLMGKKLAYNLIKEVLNKGVQAQTMLGTIDAMTEEDCQKLLDAYTSLHEI